jgi:hypothetical protein
MDIETLMISWLNSGGRLPAGWEAFGSIPEIKPEKFVLVERSGGPVDNVSIERPDLTIRFFCRDSADVAKTVATATDKKIRLEFVTQPNVSKVERNSLLRLDDLVIKWPTYMGYYSFVYHV